MPVCGRSQVFLAEYCLICGIDIQSKVQQISCVEYVCKLWRPRSLAPAWARRRRSAASPHSRNLRGLEGPRLLATTGPTKWGRKQLSSLNGNIMKRYIGVSLVACTVTHPPWSPLASTLKLGIEGMLKCPCGCPLWMSKLGMADSWTCIHPMYSPMCT